MSLFVCLGYFTFIEVGFVDCASCITRNQSELVLLFASECFISFFASSRKMQAWLHAEVSLEKTSEWGQCREQNHQHCNFLEL